MPLPEAYRQDRVIEGHDNPDYEALLAALPERVPFGQEPEIVDLRELGDRFLAVGQAMPKVGVQGVFGFVYGSLTHTLADVLDRRPEVSHLPEIENPDVLIKQANYFAQEWLNPAHDFARWGLARQRGDRDEALSIIYHTDKLWRRSFDDLQVQRASPPVQLIAGGLVNHIVKDLPPSLTRSQVTEAYMRPGGDYDNVSEHIGYVSSKLATEMMEGRGSVLRLGAKVVSKVVAYTRAGAKDRYEKIRRVDNEQDFNAVLHDATNEAMRLNELAVRYGEPMVGVFGRVAMLGDRSSVDTILPPNLKPDSEAA